MASRWATDKFTGPGSDHLWTTGFKSKLIEVEEQHIQLQIWDGQSFDAGQVTRLGKRLGHSSVSNSYYKGVKAVLVVYDPTDPASFRDVSTLCRRAEAHIDPDAKVFLISHSPPADPAAAPAAPPAGLAFDPEKAELGGDEVLSPSGAGGFEFPTFENSTWKGPEEAEEAEEEEPNPEAEAEAEAARLLELEEAQPDDEQGIALAEQLSEELAVTFLQIGFGMNDAQKVEYYEQEVNALFDTIAISVLPERRTCCDVFPEGYKDITPQEGPEGPDYLKGCKLVHMTLKAGQKDIPHWRPKHYIYVISGGKVEITADCNLPCHSSQLTDPAPDPWSQWRVETEPETAMIMPAGRYSVENVGEDNMEMLFLEVRHDSIWEAHFDDEDTKSRTHPHLPPAVPPTPEGHVPCSESDPDHYAILAEDDDWMVVKMDMKSGDEDHPHSHREHVVVCLSEGELSIWGGQEKSDEEKPDLVAPVGPLAVLPVPTGFHIVKNSGENDVSAMFFERSR